MLQLILFSIFALISNIPTLSSNKSFSKIVLLSNFILLISFCIMELSSPFVISSFPTKPNILLNT